MIFVILAVATNAMIVSIAPVAVVVNDAMPDPHCSLHCQLLPVVAGRCRHCRPAAFTTTTAAGVSNAPRPLLPPSMWHHFPVEPPWSLTIAKTKRSILETILFNRSLL
jgi:hypothetical protein